MANFADTAAINLRLGLLGLPLPSEGPAGRAVDLVRPILARQRELNRRLQHRLPAVDTRIQTVLDSYLDDTDTQPQLPRQTLVLDQAGLAREMSLPVNGDTFTSDLLTSYRLVNGILHNPANDRRTTKGVFHIADGGLPIQDDKIAVPRPVFGRLVEHAFRPPADTMVLPYTSNQPTRPTCWVSLLLRPVVVPNVPGYTRERRMETRFFAPATLMANLDFVEGIFGNAGDPYLPENDASLDPEGWTGHTGAVILAPHLTKLTKKELGLPNVDDATDRQRRDGMCWSDETELYNGGSAFKVCARDESGVIVTVIADNYFGYCKKEVKAQISYAANLLGLVEEEHAGGAITFPRYNLGQTFTDTYADDSYRIDDVIARNPERFLRQPEGHALDEELTHIVLVPERSSYSLRDTTVSWTIDGEPRSIPLRADTYYVGPDGYVVELAHIETDGSQWTLLGTSPNATSCHKPATVSGGGKSEISKSITDAFVVGNAYVNDFVEDMEQVAAIVGRDFSHPLRRSGRRTGRAGPSLRRAQRGQRHQTPDAQPGFQRRVQRVARSHPAPIKELVLVVKALLPPGVGRRLGLPLLGRPDQRPRRARAAPRWRRQDPGQHAARRLRPGRLMAALRVAPRLPSRREGQTEDDITASIVVPGAVAERTDGLSRKVCGQLRAVAVPTPRRRHPPRLRQAGGAGHRRRSLPQQLRAADGR